MGTLAKVGILGGRRVKSEVLIQAAIAASSDSEISPDDSPRVAKKNARVDSITSQLQADGRDAADRLLSGKALGRRELLSLLSNAPVSDLMKLAMIATGSESAVVLPRPLVLLPVDEWAKSMSEATLKETATQLLRSQPFAELDVTFDWRDLNNLERLIELSDELGRRRPGVRFVGPAVEDLIAWLEQGQGPKLPKITAKSRSRRAPKQILQRLSEVLFALRRAGVYRLRFSADLSNLNRFEVLDRLEEAGLTAVIGTQISEQPDEIIEEMLTLRSFIDSGSSIGVWIPFVERGLIVGSSKRGVTEMRMLRAIAVGTIALKGVPVRRASSSYLSVEGLVMAKLFGANDLGYGAIDDTTMNTFGMMPYHSLLQAFAR